MVILFFKKVIFQILFDFSCLLALFRKKYGKKLRYLERCLIDVDMITMRNFEWYIPPAYIYQKTAQVNLHICDSFFVNLLAFLVRFFSVF